MKIGQLQRTNKRKKMIESQVFVKVEYEGLTPICESSIMSKLYYGFVMM
jgi:hypothetical protein